MPAEVVLGSAVDLRRPLLARRSEDRRLSLRFSSSWASRMASSMELVMEKRSAVASSVAMFPVYAPDRVLRSGTGWRMVTLALEILRTMEGCMGVRSAATWVGSAPFARDDGSVVVVLVVVASGDVLTGGRLTRATISESRLGSRFAFALMSWRRRDAEEAECCKVCLSCNARLSWVACPTAATFSPPTLDFVFERLAATTGGEKAGSASDVGSTRW